MFDGKMLRAATGTPILSTAFANRPFADAEPEPFTFANLTTKSLTLAIGFTLALVSRLRHLGTQRPRRLARVRHREQELLHVPGARRTTLRAKPAVQAYVLVLRHDPAGLER